MNVHDVQTPALLIDVDALDANLVTMARTLPGSRCRPHVKAHKCTDLARLQAAAGHRSFTCATPREAISMAAAGLGDDLLLANETVDDERLRVLANCGARVTVAVDSEPTINAAAQAGIQEVVIDVDVGLCRCGCEPGEAGRLADQARTRGLNVRGVMGYEGHLMMIEDRERQARAVKAAMAVLLTAREKVGGDVVSAGGTGTYDLNVWANEIQAGSYALMDAAYAKLGLPFVQALFLWTTVISVSNDHAVADGGAKALAMDHGLPELPGATVLRCADEHITFRPGSAVAVGDKLRVIPAHVDPTMAKHEHAYLVHGDEVIAVWQIDMRHW